MQPTHLLNISFHSSKSKMNKPIRDFHTGPAMTATRSSPIPSCTPLDPSSCSVHSTHSAGTVRHRRLRSFSGSSLSSLSSLWAPPFRRVEGRSSSRSMSSTNLTRRIMHTPPESRTLSRCYSTRASMASILSSRRTADLALGMEGVEQRLGGVEESDGEISNPLDEGTCRTNYDAHHVSGNEEQPDDPVARDIEPGAAEPNGLRKWISTLRRRKKQKQSPSPTKPRTPWTIAQECNTTPVSPSKRQDSRHKPSDSQGSSLMFVTAMKSATATIASFSIATVSRRDTYFRRGHQRSSLLSGSDPRPSIDSQRSIADEAARHRSRKRRAKLQELVRSEEGYLADVKALLKLSRAPDLT